MKTVIIDYGSGNIESVFNALTLVQENQEILISKDPAIVRSANRLILPGVGSFADCMQGLKSVNGLIEEIRNQVLKEKKPFLGVCVGMQVLASVGYEDGEHQGLCFINGKVEKIVSENLKVPHMGWNDLVVKPNKHGALKDTKTGDHFYFANSYHFQCQNENNELAHVNYGSEICAIVSKENILGLQFHPEKSGEPGLKILKNFLNWRP
jgi:imidazole glycerol-phosphate synthase subunit HisH